MSVISFRVRMWLSDSVPAEREGGAAQQAAHLGNLPVGDGLDGHAPDFAQMPVQPGEMLFRDDDVLADGEDIGVHPVHLLLREFEDVFGSEQFHQVVGVAGIDEALAVQDGLSPSHRHERAVQVEDALVRVGVALAEVQGDDGLFGEDHVQVIQGEAVRAGRLHRRIVHEIVLAQEDVVVVQDDVTAVHMDRLRQVVDVLVMDLAVDVAVGVDLFLPVGDDVGDDDLVFDDEADIPGEDLVASLHQRRAVHLHAVLVQDGLEGAHLGDDVLVGRVNPVQDGFVGSM